MTIKERILRGLKASLFGQLASKVSNAVLMLLLTRYLLAPSEYGLLNFALSVLAIGQLFGSLGLSKSAARYVNQYIEEDESQIPFILRRTMLYVLVMLVGVGVVIAVFREQIARLVGEPALVPFLVIGIGYVVFYTYTNYLRLVFQAFNRVPLSAALTTIEGVGRLVFAAGFVLLGFGALGAFAGYTASYFVAVVVGLPLLYRLYSSFDASDRPESGLSRRILEYSVPTTIIKAGVRLDRKVDVVLVGALLTNAAVGYYTLATQLVNFIAIPAASLGFTITPTLGEQKAGDDTGRAGEIYQTSLEYTLLFYVPASVGIFLVAEPTIRHVFGTDYLGAVPVLQVLSGFVILRAINQLTSDALDYLGLARIRAYALGGMAVLNFGLNVVLIPIYGVVGAAAATMFTYSLYTVVNLYYIDDQLSLDLRDLAASVGVICGISAALGVAVAFLRSFIADLPSLLAVVLAGGLVWALLTAASGLIDVRTLYGDIVGS